MCVDDIRPRISRDSAEEDTPTLINYSINSQVKIYHLHFISWQALILSSIRQYFTTSYYYEMNALSECNYLIVYK